MGAINSEAGNKRPRLESRNVEPGVDTDGSTGLQNTEEDFQIILYLCDGIRQFQGIIKSRQVSESRGAGPFMLASRLINRSLRFSDFQVSEIGEDGITVALGDTSIPADASAHGSTSKVSRIIW